MSSGSGHASPVDRNRSRAARTVEAAIPRRRAISRPAIPLENVSRRISRTWRIATLSAGIRSLLRTSQKERPYEPAGGAFTPALPRAASSRNPGRHHLGIVGAIISERWAPSSRNGGRLRPESAPSIVADHGELSKTKLFHYFNLVQSHGTL